MVMLAVFASVIWALVRSTVASSTISKSCMEGSIDVCKNLFTPTIMYDITDVAKIGNKVNVTFKFVLPTPLKTGLGTQEMKLVLLPPNGLVFQRHIYSFERKGDIKRPDLLGWPKDKLLNAYSDVDLGFNLSKCKKPHFVEMLTKLDKSLQKDLNVYFEESITKETAGCSADYKDLREFAILKFYDVTNLEAGEYSWTGEFTYDDKYATSGCEEDGVYWTVGFLQDLEETTMNIDVKPLCINTDFLSAKRFFENAKSINAKVLACHGIKVIDKKFWMHFTNRRNQIDLDVTLPQSSTNYLLKFSYTIPQHFIKQGINKNGYELEIFLPKLSSSDSQYFSVFALDKYVKVVEPIVPDSKITYDPYSHAINIKFPSIVGSTSKYTITVDLSYDEWQMPPMSELSLFYKIDDKKGIKSQSGDVEKWSQNNWKQLTMQIKDGVVNVCRDDLLSFQRKLKDRREKNTNYIGYSVPFYTKLIFNTPFVDALLTWDRNSQYLLTIPLGEKIVDLNDGGVVKVILPYDSIKYDGIYYDASAKDSSPYDISDVYQYDEKTNQIHVVLNKKELNDKYVDFYEGYMLTIPFKSSKTPQDIISMEGWGIHIFQKDTYRGVSKLKFAIVDNSPPKTHFKSPIDNDHALGYIHNMYLISVVGATKLVIPITSTVYRYMSFVFTFEKDISVIQKDIAVISKASLRVKHVWDSMKKQLTIYVYNLESYIGKREQMTFVLDIMDSEKNVKNYGSLKIKAIGNDDGPILKSLVDIVAKFSDLKHDSDELALGNEVTLRGFTKSTEMDKICFSKQHKVESISFKDNTKGVYFMTRVHDCSEPWLPPKISNLDHLSLKIAQSGLPKNTGVHYTYRTVYQLKSLDDGPSHDELAAMQSKRFMQHTLHILFSDAACKLLSEIYKTQGKSGLDGFKAIEEFMKEVPSDWVPNVFGDIIFSYHDSKTSILHKKRKVMYVESGDIKNDEEKIERIYTFNSAFENVLSDGLGGMEADSLNESFSVIGFMNDKDLQQLWISYKPYEEKQQFPLSATYKQPIMVKGYVFKNDTDIHNILKCTLQPFGMHVKPSMLQPTKSTFPEYLWLGVTRFVEPDHYILNETISARKGDADKRVSSTMNAEIIKKKRVEKSDAVDIFIQFYKQTAPHCTTKGNIFQLLVHQFMLDIYETIARQPIIVAACMSFDDGDEHKASGKTYGLSYKGKEVLEGEDKTAMPGSIEPSVNETCNFASLQKYLPKTLYHDKSIDYKDYIFQTDQTEVKSLSDAKKMLVSDVKSVPAKTAPSVSSGYGQLGLEEMFGK
ncbi:hypothetical protein BBOV_II001950 [Babesia bovis T2Bo]|uniref:Uncharacterized protein n=1 Tax=Babesia bovis TaxID=5865 RepID=A7AT90_BABBO|nr:hypothetical protein BBOV_II001950 [Babesia bovis T2Bo]EDO06151.1 hypothetical protein BBOV_II001950 [Babesia bovis T2Bo]|eukprot:XP_001609719.1 hypothetical protein [Babesia bovis T2Bo]